MSRLYMLLSTLIQKLNKKQDKVIYTTVDPGEGSPLETEALLIVYEP